MTTSLTPLQVAARASLVQAHVNAGTDPAIAEAQVPPNAARNDAEATEILLRQVLSGLAAANQPLVKPPKH